jgi:uncharacterized protein HemX
MPSGPTTKAVDEDLGELTKDVKELSRGVADLRTEFVGFRTGVDKDLKLIKGIGIFFSGVLLAVVAGAGHVVWDAATINSEVKQHGEKFNELKSEVKQHGEKLNELKSEIKQQGGRLDKIESRLDEMAKQLDTLVRRTEPKPGA